MIAKDQNIALLIVAEAALENLNWENYANYCFAREKGLRKKAFENLNEFLNETNNWTSEQKIEFAKFLFPFCEKIPDADYGPFPQPLRDKLLKPTLTHWCEVEKSNSQPFRWFGRYYRSEDHLFKALSLDPQDDLARETLLSWWTYEIYYSVHHLPDYYIGDPHHDLKLLEKIKTHISYLSDLKQKKYWTSEVIEELEIIKNYVDWQKSGHASFEKWGRENDRQVGYQKTS